MDIYQIFDDFTHFQSLLPADERSHFNNDHAKRYQRWRAPTWQHSLSAHKADRQGQTRDNLASCAFPGFLMMDKHKAESMQQAFGIDAQLLPVNIPTASRPFVFVNVLTVLDAIKDKQLSVEERIDTFNARQTRFSAKAIADHALFRDKVHIGRYFCTDALRQWCLDNGIIGLHFELQGTA